LEPAELSSALARLQDLQREVSKAYVGPKRVLDLLCLALLARGHVLLEGVPGVAKTTLAKAFAAALGCSVRRIQFTPDLLPADITGTYVLSPRDGTFSLRLGPVFANVVLADEINRAPGKTQSALLEAMQEAQVTVEGERIELPQPFVVLATQNPVDLDGTYPLPEAQLDRFLIRIAMGYPTTKDEVAMMQNHNVAPPILQGVFQPDEVLQLQALAQRIHIEEDLLHFAANLAVFTRTHAQVALGVSPRGTLSLVRAAKAHALITGRIYVTPEDIYETISAVFSHRIILLPELEQEPGARENIVKEALRSISYRRSVRAV